MDSFNKIISFVLGLVVVLVFFAVVTGRINLKNKTNSTSASKSTVTPTPAQEGGGFFGFFKSVSPTSTSTPTPTQKSSSPITIGTSENNLYKQDNQVVKPSGVKSIPSTGLPTIFIPILISGLAGGSALIKTGKNKS